MSVFKSTKVLTASPDLIPGIAKAIETEFDKDGFLAESQSLLGGGSDISLSRGGLFKAVLGMKSALKINLQPQDGKILLEAGVGIFGQQAVPSVISLFFLWPVLITQIWGMVQQSRLDERVIRVALEYIALQAALPLAQEQKGKFCTSCGANQVPGVLFSSQCGERL